MLFLNLYNLSFHLHSYRSSNYDDSDDVSSETEYSDDDSYSRQSKKRSTRRSTRTSGRNKRSARKRIIESTDEDLTEEDEDERTRRTSRKKVSYKEQSDDNTDTDELIEVDWGDYNAEQEELGETIEKVLEHRLGKKGATGSQTTFYNVNKDGDPNANCDQLSEEDKEQQFLIKWKGRSYLHNTWENENQLREEGVKGLKKIENYLKKEEDIRLWRMQATPEDIEYYDCQEEMAFQLRLIHLNVERVISHQEVKDENGKTIIEYLCKFEGLSYSDCTYETEDLIKEKFQDKIDEYYSRHKSQKIPSRNAIKNLKYRPKFIQLKQQPDYIGGKDHLQLRDYQLDGLNWLGHSFSKGNSCCLSDEMGLGKTIQTISFLNYLSEEHAIYGPFLLVVPLSTMAAWQKELSIWAPELNCKFYPIL